MLSIHMFIRLVALATVVLGVALTTGLEAAPSVNFADSETSSPSGEWYFMRVHASDSEQELEWVETWKDGALYGLDGAGDGWDNDIPWWDIAYGSESVFYEAQSHSTSGAYSSWATHTVTISLASMTPPVPSFTGPILTVDGSGQRIAFNPQVVPAPNSSNGSGAMVFVVDGHTGWQTSAWIPPYSGTFTFHVGQLADVNHYGPDQDPVVGSMCINYDAFTLTVNKANQTTLSLSPASQTIVYGSQYSVTSSGSSGNGTLVWGGAVSGPPPWTQAFPVGVHTITAYREADANYNVSNTASAQITVTKAQQSAVTIFPGSQAVANGTTITFSASGGSGQNNPYQWSDNGTGFGTGTTAPIQLNNPGSNPFVHNISVYRVGDTNYLDSNVATVSITVNPSYYNLTVNGGTGTASYVAGTVINNITATPPAGYAFSSWIHSGAGTLANSYANPTSFTMGTGNATLTANFVAISYSLAVHNGSGDGSYTSGTPVTITADAPPAGQLFSHWSITSGLGSVTNATATPATFVMGLSPATVQAVYYTPATPVVLGLHAAGYGTTTAQSLGIDSWQAGSSSHQVTTSTGAGSGAWTALHQYRTVVPGLDYVVKITGGSYQRELRFEVPKGFTLYINDYPYADTATINMGDLLGAVGDSVEKHFFLVPNDGSSTLRAGSSIDPQLSSDDVIWAVSLGRAGNGRAVGALALRKTNVTGQAFSLDVLTITNPEVPGLLEIYNDADFLGPWGYARRFIYSPGNCWLWLDDRVSGQPTSYCEIKAYDPMADPTWDSATQTYKFKIGGTEITPFAKYVISSNAPTNDTLTIAKNKGNAQEISWTLKRTVTGNNTEWLLKNGSLQALRTVSIVSGTTTTDTVTIEDGAGNVAQRFKKVYEAFAWGKELASETNDPTGLNLQTTYTYGTSGASYGKLTSASYPDGTFAKYEYASDDPSYGKLWKTYTRWRAVASSAASATATNAKVVTTTYKPIYSYLRDAIDTITTTVPEGGTPVTIGKTEINPDFASTTFNGKKVRSETIKSFFGSGGSDYLESKRLAYHPEVTTDDLANKLISETSPTGTKRSVIFFKGYFTDNGDANTSVFKTNSNASLNTQWGEYRFHGFSTQVTGAQLVTQFDGKPVHDIYMVPNRSFVDLTVLDMGRPVRSVRYIFTDASAGEPSFEYIGGNTETYGFDLPTGVATESRSDHRGGMSKRIYYNGRLTKEITNDGMEISYQYNGLGWLIRKDLAEISASGDYAAQNAIYTHFTYDSAGRKLTEKVSNSTSPIAAGPESSYHYDSAGRLDYEVSASGLQTSYAYDLAQSRITTTFPGGATRTVETHPDGALKKITGTGVGWEYHTTAVASDGKVTQKVYALRASDESSPTSAPRWASVTTDWLGRRTRLEGPSPATGIIATAYTYNDKGQVTRVKTVDGASTALISDSVVEYDAYEVPYRSGVDLDGFAGLSPSSPTDRLTEVDTLAEKDAGVWWLKTTTKLYNQAGSATALTTSTVKQRLNQFASAGTNVQSETIALDLRDNQSRETVVVDRANRLVTTTVDWSDSSANSVSVVRNGLLVREQSASNLVTTHAYDSLRRLVRSTDPRIDGSVLAHTLAPRVGFFDGGATVGSRYQVAWAKDTAGNQSTFAYSSSTGRLESVQQPAVGGQAGKFTYYGYTLRGELYRQWGHVPHPTETTINDYGEAVLLKTFRGGDNSTWTQSSWPASPPDADLTKWVYDAATGVLTDKYDDANLDTVGEPITNAKKISYTYNKLGQLKTRKWARDVTTTYKYYGEESGELKTAELKLIDYSNTATTEDLKYTYDRVGQVLTIKDPTGERTFTYDPATTYLEKETLPNFFNSRVLTPKYDTTGTGTVGRSTGFTLGVTGSTDYDITYDYDAFGRPDSVASGGITFDYGYAPNSDLIGTINETVSGWSQIRTWVSNRNLLGKIETKVGASTKAAFVYGHDELGRRTSVAATGTMFDRYVGKGLVTRWEYNDRSEVTSARTYYGQTATDLSYPVAGRGLAFEFDHAGNRKKSAIDDRETTYGVNSLNQIKSRATPGQVEVSGLAPTASNVQANGQAVTRQGDYYHKAVSVANSSSAVHASVTVASTAPSASMARKVFVPKANLTSIEEWVYDDDGNLTRDDQWEYTWDAENRLVVMETRSEIIGSIVATADARRIEFTYDYMGRRARKVVRSGWNSGSYSGTPSLDRRFIYNGWNLAAEYDALASFAVLRTYTWGLDFSGSGQGAGGVGGLLMTRQGATDYVYAYDGNGNVASVMNRTSGAVVAEYEYSAFGDLIRATGTYAQTNPFRFSTKYTDDETGLVYYGLRYYSPMQGRFLGRDPIGEQGGLNLYAFCGNNGVNHWDYLGLLTPDEKRGALAGIFQAGVDLIGSGIDAVGNFLGSIFGGGDDSGGSYYGGPIFIDFGDPGIFSDADIDDLYDFYFPEPPKKVAPPFTPSAVPERPLAPEVVSPTAPTGTTGAATNVTDSGPVNHAPQPVTSGPVSVTPTEAPGGQVVHVSTNATTGPKPVVSLATPAAPTTTPTPARPVTQVNHTAPNSGATLEQPVAGGSASKATAGGYGFVLQPGVVNNSHHIATDGKGGLKVVVAPGDVPFAYTNPVILNSIKIHEGSHIIDAYNYNNAIGNGQPAGIPVGVMPGGKVLTELTAIDRQLTYINRNLAPPNTLTPVQVQQIDYYKVHVENYRNTLIGLPKQPMPPYPGKGP